MTNDFKPAKAGGNQPRLSKEEYAEKKRAEKEKVYQMIDDAAREIVSDPEKFKNFLDTQSRMDRYSAANALLIYSQYPQATQLKDFDDWGKDNVKITKGAKSISIERRKRDVSKRIGTAFRLGAAAQRLRRREADCAEGKGRTGNKHGRSGFDRSDEEITYMDTTDNVIYLAAAASGAWNS